jgi:hypothetical protein
VNDEKYSPDIWDSLSFIVWCLLFLIGLFPEMVYLTIRESAGVMTKGAFTNTPLFITLAGTAFLGGFTYNRSRLWGDDDDRAIVKSVHMMLLTFIAFAPIHIEQLPLYLSIPVPFYRRLLLSAVTIKVMVWLILLIFLLRYHMFQGLPAFRRMPLIFWMKFLTSYREEEAAPSGDQEKDAKEVLPDKEKTPGENSSEDMNHSEP